jgi:protein-disulfide isomerase
MRRLHVAALFLTACGASLPPPIAAELRLTPPGQATVVEFVDFECPFCRRHEELLTPLLAKHPGRVRVVRKQVPLGSIHPHAEAAARAAACADTLGKGDEMASALFHAQPAALTDEGTVALAEDLGLDGPAFGACLGDARTKARIAHDQADYEAAAGAGVPLVYIGRERFEGLQDQATLEAALARALGAATASRPPREVMK